MLYSCSFCSIDSAGNHQFNCPMNPISSKTVTGCVNPFINIHDVSHVSIPIALRDDLVKFLEAMELESDTAHYLLKRFKGT